MTAMVCLECGKTFKKNIGANTYEVKCPKCGGYDTDIAGVRPELVNEIKAMQYPIL